MSKLSVTSAAIVLPCADLQTALPFYTERLGFRLESIFPADSPSTAVLSGHGIRLRLQPDEGLAAGQLRLRCGDGQHPGELLAPNGTRIVFAGPDPDYELPPIEQAPVVTRAHAANAWVPGRAGMQYRDLLPGRLGGRFIASHIRIVDGGPVPDYVHYHDVRLQLIFCYRGWVRVVYEDQGPDFVMRAGDCVLQPPGIRHRVLESCAGAEVIEVGSPAQHMTRVDHDMALPTSSVRAQRYFAGQRFVRHNAASAVWAPWRLPGFEARDTGVGMASGGLADVRVARACGVATPVPWSHAGEFLFMFVLQGDVTLAVEGSPDHALEAGDAISVPAGLAHTLQSCSADLELLEVTLPARLSGADEDEL